MVIVLETALLVIVAVCLFVLFAGLGGTAVIGCLLRLVSEQNTSAGPMADLMATARAVAAGAGVQKVTVFIGVHQADVSMRGASIIAVTDDNSGLARRDQCLVVSWDTLTR